MTDPIAELTARVEHLEAVAAILALSADYCRGAGYRELPLFLVSSADEALDSDAERRSQTIAPTGR